MAEYIQPDKLLRLQTASSLRKHKNIREAIKWYRENPSELSQRTSEFDNALKKLSKRISDPEVDGNTYHHAQELKELLKGKSLPVSLREISHVTQTNPNSELLNRIKQTFEKVNVMISGEWSWAGNLNPHQTASGLLIEGFGLMAENQLGIPNFRRTFVLALEEELIINQRGTSLLNDVIGWMKEEKESFSTRVQKEIDRF